MKQEASARQVRPVRVMFGGDVMLGRNVKECILRYGPGYPLGPIAPLMRASDLAIVNLECALTASLERWPGLPKAYYFGAPPLAAEVLSDAGIGLVSLANNHVLDYGEQGLRDTLRLLGELGIALAGAGPDLAQARSAAIVDCGGTRFGMAAFCDHQPDFAAYDGRPGIAYLDLDDEAAALRVLRESLAPLLRAAVDWPILSLHWGPNMVRRPTARFRRIAHAAIDMGWKILFGHSAHVFHGVELYRGCPILYAAGDLVDDYHVDPAFRNDHQLLFELELEKRALHRIALYPVLIARCQARLATGDSERYIADQVTALCAEFGTPVRQRDGRILIEGVNEGASHSRS